MDARLVEAAQNGDFLRMRDLMRENPLLFKPAALVRENPLHIACPAGHVDFVKEVLNLRPEFAKELNLDGFSPLHIASAYGHLEIVEELVKVGGRKLCLVKGKDGRIALHYAVAGGKIEIIKVLLSACLDSILETTSAGESCFHIALKIDHSETLGLLTSQVISLKRRHVKFVVNKKDSQGNSIVHLAVSRKQYEVLQFWLATLKDYLDVSSFPKDLISDGGRGHPEIGESLIAYCQNAQIFRSPVTKIVDNISLVMNFKLNISVELRNTLLVVAALIVTTTYQAILSPPGGFWQDDLFEDEQNTTYVHSHRAGDAIMYDQNWLMYLAFVTLNSVGFLAALTMLEILTRGLPLSLQIRWCCAALATTYCVSVGYGVGNGLSLYSFYVTFYLLFIIFYWDRDWDVL